MYAGVGQPEALQERDILLWRPSVFLPSRHTPEEQFRPRRLEATCIIVEKASLKGLAFPMIHDLPHLR